MYGCVCGGGLLRRERRGGKRGLNRQRERLVERDNGRETNKE